MTSVRDSSVVRAAGRWCIAGALIGAAGGLVTAFYPPAVGEDRFSYPYTETGFLLAETSFLVNHVLLLVGLLGLARAGAAGNRPLGRIGLATGVVGMAALTVCEVLAMLLANEPYPSPRTSALDAGYGVASLLIGGGLIATGIAVIRTGRWTGWHRYTVLACGLGLFLLMLPGLAAGFLAARLGVTAWVLLWVGVGLALIRTAAGVHPAPDTRGVPGS